MAARKAEVQYLTEEQYKTLANKIDDAFAKIINSFDDQMGRVDTATEKIREAFDNAFTRFEDGVYKQLETKRGVKN